MFQRHFRAVTTYGLLLREVNAKSQVLFIQKPVNFHSSAFHYAKHFQERENEYSHSVMEKNDKYSFSVTKHPLKCKRQVFKSSLIDEYNEFASVSLQNFSSAINIEDKQYTNLISKISQTLAEAKDDDINKLLYHLCLWPPTFKTYTRNFKTIWNSLDSECVNRLSKWDVSFQLLIADYWFHLRLSRITNYNKILISSLLDNVNSLTSSQVVQLMFLINLQRKIPQNFLSQLEMKLEKIINSLSSAELGIVCLGFFKTKSKINNENLIKVLINHFLKDISNVNTVSVAAILKFFRKSLHASLTDLYISLMHRCVSQISSFDIPTSVHVALLSSECNVYHPLLLDTVSDKLKNNIESARLKDCAKLLQCSSHFNHYNSEFHEIYKKEVYKSSRQEEIENYPRDILYASIFYAYMGHFDYDMLSIVLTPTFIDNCLSKYPEAANIFAELDYCIEIECKDYSGPRLEKNALKVVVDRQEHFHLQSSANPTMQYRLLNEIYQSLQDILCSNSNILIHHILPHLYAADVIVRINQANEKSLSDLYRDFPPESILIPPKNEIWICFVVCGLYSFAYKSKHMTGVTVMKLRQLQNLGYKTIFMPYYTVPTNISHRKNFIKGLLNSIENGTFQNDAEKNSIKVPS